MDNKDYSKILEESIAQLSQEDREKLYYPCAVACVQGGVLEMQRQIFEANDYDMDRIYSDMNTEYTYGRIVESGKVYDMGYPRCLCPMVEEGRCSAPTHCECSRQSIYYVLHEMLPGRKIRVETMETVLKGDEKCRFRIYLDE